MKYFPKIFLPLLASAVPAMGSAPDGLVEGVKVCHLDAPDAPPLGQQWGGM